MAGGSPYGMTFGGAGAGAGGMYAPPPYDQLQHHQAIPALSQQLPVSFILTNLPTTKVLFIFELLRLVAVADFRQL